MISFVVKIGFANELSGHAFRLVFQGKSSVDPIVWKMERRLSGWEKLYLLKRGMLTLNKCTLSNLPTNYLSLLLFRPSHVSSRLEKLHRNFLWSRSEDEFKFH